MTKDELYENLKAGKTMDQLFHFTGGQECLIFKADALTVGEDILYIPDISLNDVSMDSPLKDDDEIRAAVGLCYTGRDFVDLCSGDVELAKRLFSYCDWQHPSSALPEIEDSDEDSASPLSPRYIELTLPSGITLRATAYDTPAFPCIDIDLLDAGGELERVCFVEHNPEKPFGHELCVGVYCAGDDETVYYNSYNLNDTE